MIHETCANDKSIFLQKIVGTHRESLVTWKISYLEDEQDFSQVKVIVDLMQIILK